MKIKQIGEKVVDALDGIYLDYAENTFLFIVKSDIWTEEEIKSARRKDVLIHYIQKGCIDAFLLEIEDCLECSDLPFDIHDGSPSLLDSLQKEQDYSWQILLLDRENTVVFEREGAFEKKHSDLLKEKLRARLLEKYTSENVDEAYARLAQQYEPFELEQFSVFEERSTRK